MAQLSIIIPTLNEAVCIGETLRNLSKLGADVEIILVDGGSSDPTVEIARGCGVRVLLTAPGRGDQMHTGACAACGNALWFLHADTHPPHDAATRILETLCNPGVVGGNFRLKFDGQGEPARLLTRIYPHLRKLGLCYGDSGIFVRRRDYENAGGFRSYPVFEDLDLIQRLKRRGRFVHLETEIVTSSRRFDDRGFTLTFARWTAMQVLYWVGVPPRTLGRAYAPVRAKK